jgi:hypothetical protein
MLSIATLFRKHWIDVEKVPFPHVLVAHELLVRVVPERKEKIWRPLYAGAYTGGCRLDSNDMYRDSSPGFPISTGEEE